MLKRCLINTGGLYLSSGEHASPQYDDFPLFSKCRDALLSVFNSDASEKITESAEHALELMEKMYDEVLNTPIILSLDRESSDSSNIYITIEIGKYIEIDGSELHGWYADDQNFEIMSYFAERYANIERILKTLVRKKIIDISQNDLGSMFTFHKIYEELLDKNMSNIINQQKTYC